MDRGRFYESMIRLYLRLNGYFQTGLISHSNEWGNNLTEIDSIAVRFPFHQQPEREVAFCPALEPSLNEIELVLAEVKSNSVNFKNPLKTDNKNADRNWNQILNWVGLFKPEEINRLIPLLKAVADADKSCIKGVMAHSDFAKVKVRPLIFSFAMAKSTSDPKDYISGDEIIEYIWLCLSPEENRTECSIKYPLSNWGDEFAPIVQFFKDRNEKNLGKPSVADLTQFFNLI